MSEQNPQQHPEPDETDPHAAVEPARQPSPGDVEPAFGDPGLPPHQHRRTDVDARAAKIAELQVSGWFLLSMLGALLFIVAYFAIPLEGDATRVSLSTKLMGGGLAIALFAIGIGAVHWAKKLMPDDEVVEERHPVRSTDEEQAAAGAMILEGGAAAGFPRRRIIWGSLFGALGTVAIAPIIPLWGLWTRNKNQTPAQALSETVWRGGMRLVTDPDGRLVKAADIPIGGVVHVLPQVTDGAGKPINGVRADQLDAHGRLNLNEMAKAVVLVVRLEPGAIKEAPDRQGWTYNGIVAYSKICTHVGCPVALAEQTTHHLLCPCHQSTFDLTDGAKRIFGPAKRALPQLAVTVDPDGYLVSKQGFMEPVGPSFFERG